MRTPRYWLRRAVVILAHYDNVACTLPSCPEPRVGLTVWCREHVNQILEDRQEPEMVAHLTMLRTPFSARPEGGDR